MSLTEELKKLPPEQRIKFVQEERIFLGVDEQLNQDWEQNLIPGNKARDIGEIREKQWPEPLEQAAFYGIAGEIIRAIEPYSEADPAALLITFLVAMGNLLNRVFYFPVGVDQHFANMYAVIVGKSAKGRKGMSWNFIKKLLENVDEQWSRTKTPNGLSSGEGLIFAVRDPVIKTKPIQEKKGGPTIGYEDVIEDDGVYDKRLMVVEGEFAQALKVMSRQGNTLSPVIRQAWDTGNLNTIIKNSRNQATGAHISIIGHITAYELQLLLKEVEFFNGFGNRFLYVCAKRSKSLPDGAEVPEEIVKKIGMKLTKIRDFIGTGIILSNMEERKPCGSVPLIEQGMKRDSESAIYWRSIYSKLTEEQSGMLGAILSRAEAHVLRLSMLYALLDCSNVIRVEHIDAALAVWHYCYRSAVYIFEDISCDPIAEEILVALQSGPKTQTDIVNIFDRNKPSSVIKQALSDLLEQGRIRKQLKDNYDKNGRKCKSITLFSLAETN